MLIREIVVTLSEMQITSLASNYYDAVLSLAKTLPEWFTPEALQEIESTLTDLNGFVAVHEEKVRGFVLFAVNEKNEAEIKWLGVSPLHQRRGIGRQLLQSVKETLKHHEISVCYVSTLGDAVDYEPYSRTRAFYRSQGFREHKRIQHPDKPSMEEELILRWDL